jgi:amino acid adenylation domain-containing protein
MTPGTVMGEPFDSARLDELDPAARDRFFEGLMAGSRSSGIERRGARRAPLSFGQRRLWFLHQLEPASSAHNLHSATRLRGELDATALTDAFASVVARHEVLRSTIDANHGDPVQVVQPTPAFPLERFDLRSLDSRGRERSVVGQAQRFSEIPFSLDDCPMVRAQLLQLAGDEHVLLVQVPHLVADGWSLGILLEELQVAYAAIVRGGEPAWAPLPIQYSDYSMWLTESIAAIEARDLPFWVDNVGAHREPLDLVTDRPRPSRQTFSGASLTVCLPVAVVHDVQTLCRDRGATPFMGLLSAFAVLICAHGATDSVAIGSPVAGRTRPELEPLIGYFGNMLVLQADLTGDPSFNDLVDRMRAVVLRALDHQDLPFERLVEAVSPPRQLSHTPLFQVAFVHQNAPSTEFEFGRLSAEPLDVGNANAPYDLDLDIAPRADGSIDATFTYNADLFDRWRIERMAEHYIGILHAVLAEPTTPVAHLDWLTPQETRDILRWNDTTRPPAEARHFMDAFERLASARPHAPAARCGSEELSYRELDVRSGDVARVLRADGIQRGDRVGMLADRSMDYLVALLGILRAGAVYVPFPPTHPPSRLRRFLNVAQPRALIAEATHRSLADDVIGPDGPTRRLELDVVLAEKPNPGAVDGEPIGINPGDLAYVLFTSGSTGEPKGVMVDHRGFLNHLLAKIEDLGMTAIDRLVQNGPQSFDISVWQFLAPLACGAAVEIVPDDIAGNPGALLECCSGAGATVLQVVPAMLRELLAEAAGRDADWRDRLALRWIVPTGDALPLDVVQSWFELFPDVPVLNTYGATECSDDQCHAVIGQLEQLNSEMPIVTIGSPVRNMQAHVLDRDLAPVPIGVPGELYLGGIGVGPGYLGSAQLTALAFVPDPFTTVPGARMYATGDRVVRREDGSLQFLGREGDLIKIRGFRVEPGEVQSALLKEPDVREALVVEAGPPGDQRLVAYVETSGGADIVRPLRQALGQRLPAYMVPATILPLERFPLNTSGKIDRRALPPPDYGRSRFDPPGSELEEYVSRLWADLLQVERVGRQDSFFELGGHSIIAVRMLARIASERQVDLPLTSVFEHEILADFATAIEQAETGHVDLEAMLQMVEAMSDSEVEEALENDD